MIPITVQLANPPALGVKATTTVRRARTARSGSCCYGPASQRDSRSEAPAGPAGCHARVFILETLCYLNQMECFAPSANEPA